MPELNFIYTYKQMTEFFNERQVQGGKQRRQQLNRWNKIWDIETINKGKYIIRDFHPKPVESKNYKYKLNIGDKFDKLTIISPIGDYKYLCQCECGNQTIANAYSLIYGHTKSCGCIHSKISKHKQSKDIIKERNKLTPSLRFAILKRDNYHCRICGRGVEDNVKLEIDHIIPVSKGGLTEENNLWTLCFDCNRGKASNEI